MSVLNDIEEVFAEEQDVDGEVEQEGENDTSEEDETEDEQDSQGEEDQEEKNEKDTAKDKPKPKKENGVQKRIDELTREKYELRRQIEELKGKSSKPNLPEKPDPQNFKTEREYRDAVVKYNTTVELTQKQVEQDAEREYEQTMRSVSDKVRAEKHKFEDFENVVQGISHVSLHDDVMADFVLNDKNGVEALYWLGQHPRIAEEISTMSAAKQARTLGALSEKIEAKKAGKKVSGAPKPPSKVNGSGKPATKDPGKMTPAEYIAYRTKKK